MSSDEPKIKKKYLEQAKSKTDLNMHDDHVASCLCCRFLSSSDAEPGYGEYTPGSTASISCSENVVDFDPYYFIRSLRLMHDWGPYCPRFSPRSDPASIDVLSEKESK